MEELEVKVIRYYVDEELSEAQICEKIGLPSKTVRRILQSNRIVKRSISEAIRCLNVTKFGKGRFSLKKILDTQDELLRASGVMLYWGEGSKQGRKVCFANSDPEMIRVFLEFLRRICGVSEQRLRIAVHYYEDHNIESLTQFWSDVSGIPTTQFHKPQLHKRRPTGTYRNPSRYGTVSIQYSDSELLSVIMLWTREYKSSFLKEKSA